MNEWTLREADDGCGWQVYDPDGNANGRLSDMSVERAKAHIDALNVMEYMRAILDKASHVALEANFVTLESVRWRAEELDWEKAGEGDTPLDALRELAKQVGV